LEASTGLSTGRFEEQWHHNMRRRYGLLTWGVAGGLWLILACAVALLWWVRRERDRPRRVALDQGWVIPDEPPENPPPIGVPQPEPVPGPVDPRAS
ncbi:MAG TPA: hypothetical protein VG817_02635, partial [Gemmatimonadales bacterium]|nr:hypothetical protein [Gemmatimonadales bacterium]